MAVVTKRYKVILIEEGLGNLNTCFYYTRDALQYAADKKVFEGKKSFADHPDAIEAKTRPERSVRDAIGYYEKVHVEDGPAGQALLVAELVIPITPEFNWACTMIETAIDTSGKFDGELIGLSINASGQSEEISLEKFMAEATIPISALPKLLEAQAAGIEQIEVCNKLTDAVSCDIVTEAGAKGRFKQVLESEKKRMPKAPKVDPKLKKKPAREAEDGGADGDHADADQDVELIKSLLKQYVGGEDHSDEEVESMKQALGHAKEMGMEGEEANKMAGYAMKMAKHVASKEPVEADEAEEADGDPADGKGQPSGNDTPAPAGDPGKPGSKKESAAVAELKARNAALEARLDAMELEKHVEKSITESKLPTHAQKKFRECLGKPKTQGEVTEKLKLFKEAFGTSSADVGFVNPDRDGGGEAGSGKLSFADCVEKD